MTGRKEHEDHIKNLSLNALDGYPKLFLSYYKEGAGKQETSRNNFLYKALRLYDYLVNTKGYTISTTADWAKITRRDLKDYLLTLKERDLEYATMLNNYNALKKFFKYLVKEEIIQKSPLPELSDIDSIISSEDVEEKEAVYMTPEEVAQVCDSIWATSKEPKRDICLFKLGCRTGLRASALTEIDIDDIDFENRRLFVVEKGKKFRQIVLDSDTIRLLRECIQEREQRIAEWGAGSDLKALFIKKHGGVRRISKWHVATLIDNNTQMLDKHITPHKMRSTCITNTYNMTGDIYAASRKAGHRSVSTTKRYINTTDKDERIANELANLY